MSFLRRIAIQVSLPLLALTISVNTWADYKRLLREGASIDKVKQLYEAYARDVLHSSGDATKTIETLAGGFDHKDSFLLACLSNGWPIRSIDIDHRFHPPAGVWAFSEKQMRGLLRQFPSNCQTLDCVDVSSLEGFDIKSAMIGDSVQCQVFQAENFSGESAKVHGSVAVLKQKLGSFKIRTAPRVDYVTLSQFKSSSGKASMRLHISGANIDSGAVITVDGNDLSGTHLQTRLDNSAWLGLGTDIAKAGYNMDPTYFAFPIYHYDLVSAPLSNAIVGTTISISVRNPDGQRTTTPLSFQIPTPETLDSDGDGLLDSWETGGVDGLDLPSFDANPNRKDLYVEVDRMIVPGRVWSDFSESAYPRPGIFPEIVAEFARAPILNPDGSSGITIHIDYGQEGFGPAGSSRGGTEIPWKRYIAFKDESKMKIKNMSQYCNATAIHDDTNYFDANRRRVFRYCIFGDQQWSSRSTGGGNKSSIFFLSLGVCRLRAIDHNYQRGVFIHELGHLLSLGHAGNQSARWFNSKPNFNSLMNYLFVFDGHDVDGNVAGEETGQFKGDFVYAYSEGMRADLDEGKLSEVLGVANHYPIDWDNDGAISRDPIRVLVRKHKTAEVMTDCADWARLSFPIKP